MKLVPGKDIFTMLDLLRKAAQYKGLKLQEGQSRAMSEPIKVYTLDDRLLAILAEQGIRQYGRPDCRNEILTLEDENPQKYVPGFVPSNYWNFKLLEGKKNKFDLRVSLSVGLGITTKGGGGVVFWPQAHGSFLSPVDELPNFRMFKALVESDKDAPVVAKELAASKGSIIVSWTDLGLGGICGIFDLFVKFTGRNERVLRLGMDSDGIFCPHSNPRNVQPGDRLFVAKHVQTKIIETWNRQLKQYKEMLVV